MDILYATYPFSIGFMCYIFSAGVLVTTLLFGFIGGIIMIFCLYLGIVRISPILKLCAQTIDLIDPELIPRARENIRKSFIVEYPYGKLPATPHIFSFHPHGTFSISNVLHVGTDFTNWSYRPIKGTLSSNLKYIPGSEEVLSLGNCVTSNYDEMKSEIRHGNSITVCMGGIREILYIKPNKLTLTIRKKQGIFRLAIETGKPLVPVITYGENELIDLIDIPIIRWIQEKIIPYGFVILIPTIESCIRWLSILYEPMNTPIRTVIGNPVDVGKPRIATAKEIEDLREKYFVALRELYKKTKTSSYAEEIEIV